MSSQVKKCQEHRWAYFDVCPDCEEESEPKCDYCGNTLIATPGPLCSWCIHAWSKGEAKGAADERARIVAWLRTSDFYPPLHWAANDIERGEHVKHEEKP